MDHTRFQILRRHEILKLQFSSTQCTDFFSHVALVTYISTRVFPNVCIYNFILGK